MNHRPPTIQHQSNGDCFVFMDSRIVAKIKNGNDCEKILAGLVFFCVDGGVWQYNSKTMQFENA